jgi:hypothetical protein
MFNYFGRYIISITWSHGPFFRYQNAFERSRAEKTRNALLSVSVYLIQIRNFGSESLPDQKHLIQIRNRSEEKLRPLHTRPRASAPSRGMLNNKRFQNKRVRASQHAMLV